MRTVSYEDSGGDAEHYRVDGLRHPVEILLDRWGIPHIYARSTADLFVAQGFNAARDRLVQLDLWRRRHLGRMAAAFGPEHLAADRAARLLLYRGSIHEEWAAYGTATRQAVSGFVRGINAYLDWLLHNPQRLPREFSEAGFRPERWQPEDVIRPRTHAPCYNLLGEYHRARIAAVAGLDADQVRARLAGGHRAEAPDGKVPELPPEVLRDYLIATGRPAPYGPSGTAAPEQATAPPPDGSNAWALSAERSATGRPILAADPHRPYATPSLRYLAHLSAPGLDVIGAGEPQMPGIALGHNGTAAFAFTVHTIDSEDLVVSDRRRLTRVVEDVEVAGEGVRQVELAFAPDGPVLYEDDEQDLAYVLRSTWLQPGTAPYLASLRTMTATCWDEFDAAADGWRYPGENLIYADTHGTIGLRPAGLVPRRRGYDGLLPVPAGDAFGWDNFRTSAEFWRKTNPPEGFLATANELNVPDGYPLPSYEWPDAVRHRRIVQVLSGRERHSVSDSMALQTDLFSLGASEVQQALRMWAERGVDTARVPGLDLLLGWDGVQSADSAAAAFFEFWWARELAPVVKRTLAPEAAGLILAPDARVVRDWVRSRAIAGDPDGLLERSLRQADVQLRRRLGADVSGWRWGDLHSAVQRHPLRSMGTALDVGPEPVGGSASTVSALSFWPYDFTPSNGPSVRMVIDVGGWDNSVCVNTPGQSGDPDSPHYRDLFEHWRNGRYVPMLYSREAIEAHTERRITLTPAGS